MEPRTFRRHFLCALQRTSEAVAGTSIPVGVLTLEAIKPIEIKENLNPFAQPTWIVDNEAFECYKLIFNSLGGEKTGTINGAALHPSFGIY